MLNIFEENDLTFLTFLSIRPNKMINKFVCLILFNFLNEENVPTGWKKLGQKSGVVT